MDGTVANARLLSLTLERFKSYSEATTIEFSALTVILGRNNSGKSSIIQALLLLKQTLALPRPEVPLHLEGFVDALNLREITYGRPPAGPDVPGPRIGLRWTSSVDMNAAWEAEGRPDCDTIARNTGSDWFSPSSWVSPRAIVVELGLDYSEQNAQTVLGQVTLACFKDAEAKEPEVRLGFTRQANGEYACFFWDEAASKLKVEMDHFLPYLLLERRNVGPRDRQRSWYHAFRFLFAQPLDDIKTLLLGFAYLGSMRTLPPTLYRAATVPPNDLGVSGPPVSGKLSPRPSAWGRGFDHHVGASSRTRGETSSMAISICSAAESSFPGSSSISTRPRSSTIVAVGAWRRSARPTPCAGSLRPLSSRAWTIWSRR